jgi:hypothetical protein
LQGALRCGTIITLETLFVPVFWTALCHCWSCWADVLVIVNPETVIGWHRAG